MPYRKEVSYWSLPVCPADAQRRHFDLYSKWSKDINNKRLKGGEHSAGQEETEIKRCYGGEENEEKVDPSKDDKFPWMITQTPSSVSEKSSCSKSENDHVRVKAVTDNKMAEDTNRNVASVKDHPLCNEKSTSHTEVKPQSVFSNQFNNFDERPSNDIRKEEEKLTTGVLNIYNVVASAFPNDNLLNHYVREQNMTNSQQQRKNLQKHVSDALNRLRSRISTAEEGVDEKSLGNSLVSLYQKLHSKLTSQQLKKVMETIGMKGKQLMQDSNVLSKGGDPDLKEGGGKVFEENYLCGDRQGSGTVIHDEGEEKVDILEKNCEDIEAKYESREKDSGQGVFDGVESEDQVEEVLEKDDTVAKHPGNETETSESVLEEVVVTSSEDNKDSCDTTDKAVDESMEKNTQKESDMDDEEDMFGGVDEIHDAPLTDLEEDERCPFHKQSTFPGPSVHKFQLYRFWRKRYLQNRKKKVEKKWNIAKEAGLAKPGGYEKLRTDTDGPETTPDTFVGSALEADEYRNEKLDVRAGYYRTRSCMNTGGGGNSSMGGQSGSSGSSGSSSSRNRGGCGRRDSNDSNDSNNPDNNRKGHDRQPSDTSLPHPQHLLVEADIPGKDYKAVRKKHAEMIDEKLIDLLGSLSPDTSPGMEGDPGLLKDVNHCMLIVLHELSNQDGIDCSVCNVLHYLFNHFARCQLLYKKCNICWQVHRLSLYHVQCCLQAKKTARESSSDICQQLLESVTFKVELVQSRSEQLFLKMKKYVDKVLHPYGLHGSGSLGMYNMSEKGDGSSMPSDHSQTATLTLEDSMPSVSTVKGPQVPAVAPVAASSFGGQFSRTGSGRIYQPSLKGIPESPQRDLSSPKVNWKARGRGRVGRQLSNEAHAVASRFVENSLVGSKSDDGPSIESVRHARKTDLPHGSIGELAGEGCLSLPTVPTDGGSNRSSWGPIDDSSLATSVSSGHDEGPTAYDVIYDKYKPMMDTQGNIFQPEIRTYSTEGEVDKIYGVTGAMSLPIRSTFQGEHDQNISLTMAPTGEPGIGEVVYGTRRQLKKVARFWANIRGQLDHESYKYQMREEGVILESAKKHLRILRTRYQKKNQWMRLVHLGNGVAGKCHLARDSTTGFSFCVKRVHIAKYEENELVIWCDLDHTNIVKLYGAIRHGPKIYIFCEFVDGGSLTSLINEQRNLNRRLSHWMCLRYFKQLLQVLVYLQARNVLHEDLKADNILVKRNTTLIAVTDFGLGKYLNVDSEMKGMSPTGSQTQWSPEKATSIGHGFAADVWAAVCILVHMLSGHPPWTQRFPGAQMLHFVIFMQSPPLDDIPANVQEVVRDLITQGFTVDPKLRPSAAKLLKHPAFKVLEQGAPTSYYSTLKSTGQPLPDNQLGPTETSGPQEMEEILSSLAARSQAVPHGSRQSSLSEKKLPSVQFHVSGEGSSSSDLASSLAKHNEGSLPSSSSQPHDENDGPRPVALMAGASSLVPVAGAASTGRHSTSTAEAPGAQEHQFEEGNEASSEEHPQELPKLPTFLQHSLHDIPDGVPGDSWSFSQLSFEDSDLHIRSFLGDDVPIVEFLPSSQALSEYRPAQRIPLSLDNMPRLSLLLDNNQLTYSGITLDEQNTLSAQLEMKSEKYEAFRPAQEEIAPSAVREDTLLIVEQSFGGNASSNPGQSFRGDGTYSPRQSSRGDGAYSPRQSSRGDGTYSPRQSSRGDEAYSPRQSSRGDGTYSPRQSSRGDGAYSAGLSSRGDGTYSPRQSSRGDGTYSPRQSSRGDGAYSAGLSSRGDGTYSPRQSSRGDGTYSPRQSSRGDGAYSAGLSSRGDGTYSPRQSSRGDGTYSPRQSSRGDGAYSAGLSSRGDGTYSPRQSSRGDRTYSPVKSSRGDGTYSPRQSSRGDRSSNHGQSSRESSLEGRLPSPVIMAQQINEFGLAMNNEGQYTPDRLTPLPVLQSTPNTSPLDIRVTPSPQDDFGPTSYYPPTGFYEEHIDSSDLFGDGSEEAKAVDDAVLKFETTSNNQEGSSLETMDDRSDCRAGTEIEEIIEEPNFDFSGITVHTSPQSGRKSRPPSKSVTSFFRGTPDYAVETSKTKDCPIESESIDIPGAGSGSQPCDDVAHARKQEGGRSLEKKNPGLTIDVSCNKKLAYKRNQSTPAESKLRSPPSVKHPQSDPMQSNAGTRRGKNVDPSSGLGASLPYQGPSESRLNSSRSSDTSGVFLPDKGRLSSTEFSPKSLFDHQEQEFSALGKASQSDLSAQEHQDMMAMVDIPDEDIRFALGPEHESFENQLLSVQKHLNTESDVSEFGTKLHLIRENGESVKKMRVPRHYEDWGKLMDTIRQAVKDDLGYDHYTLKNTDGSPVNYSSTPSRQDRKVMVCCLEAGETTEGCWCDQHESQLMHFA